MNEHADLPFSAPAERNREPIAQVLSEILPAKGLVLEIASGTGQHVEYFAQTFPQLNWQPSDQDPRALHATSVRGARSGLSNLRAPLTLDVLGEWPALSAHAVIVANLFHIAPVEVVAAVFRGAQACLPQGGLVHVYGPFRRDGAHTSASNEAFDADLRARDARWGIRDLEYVLEQAQAHGFDLLQQVAMPANNLSIAWQAQ